MLEGIRVIDFTNYLPGPYATLRLADMGAEIIKIEPPTGDPARNTGVSRSGEIGPVFLAQNRGKKSITLNLKTEQGRNTALQLIANADAVIESFRPKVMEKLGLGYEQVKKVNPRVVYVSITGYGMDEPMAELGSHDLNYMALSGVLAQLKDREGRPIHPSNTFADFIGGMAAAERLLAGLVSRSKTGKGSYHCLSLADTMASFMTNHVLIEQRTGYTQGVAVLNGTIVSYGLYETKDGRYVSMGALEPKFWQHFCHAVGREDWVSAHFSQTIPENPVYLELQELFKTKTLSEWTAFSQQVDCCLAPVLEAGELAAFPYFRERGIIYDSPLGGRQVKMHSDLAGAATAVPPTVGEHNHEVIKD
jgi:alpha-methylacyl-CoA racemase